MEGIGWASGWERALRNSGHEYNRLWYFNYIQVNCGEFEGTGVLLCMS